MTSSYRKKNESEMSNHACKGHQFKKFLPKIDRSMRPIMALLTFECLLLLFHYMTVNSTHVSC